MTTSSSFVGRKKELKLLREKNWRNQAQLIVIYGRRRVGKTALIEQAYKDQPIWKFEGLEGVSPKRQLAFFTQQLCTYAGLDYQTEIKNMIDWQQAFSRLAEAIKKENLVIFFDEFQWLANMDEAFVSLFKYYWDNEFSKKNNCRFVICGSVSSFIIKKVLYSKALYGRVDTEICLKPLNLNETLAFFTDKTTEECLNIYMAFGGIPQYLLELNPKLSYIQNINEYALSQNGFFFNEFNRLFISHFATVPHYEKILLSLNNQKKTLDQLAAACDIKKGGNFSRLLDELIMAGFIEKEAPIGVSKNSKIIRYRLLDEYLNFYFTFIYPHVAAIQKGQFLFHLFDMQKLKQWQGYAFERLCLKHATEIATHLRFSGIAFQAGAWFQRAAKRNTAIQVDLLFIRKDKVLSICEIKYVDSLVGSKIIENFNKKLSLIQDYFPSYSLQKVLILGKKIHIPKNIQQFFDAILLASDIFF